MKIKFNLITVFMVTYSCVLAQTPKNEKSANQTKNEKIEAIKKLENKIKIDSADLTFPKEDLVKEKKELENLKNELNKKPK